MCRVPTLRRVLGAVVLGYALTYAGLASMRHLSSFRP
jgi:hypothetical protein